jgi:hypothetical protein
LKISPLLLAGFVERAAADHNEEGAISFKIKLEFSGNEMLAVINRQGQAGDKPMNILDEDMQKRLTELYSGKFDISHSSNEFKLRLILDEER